MNWMLPSWTKPVPLLIVMTLAGVTLAQRLTPSAAVYRPGETVTLAFAEVRPDHEVGGARYVEIHRAGTNGTPVQTRYLQSDLNGQVTVPGLPGGAYEARLYYGVTDRTVRARAAFTVGGPTPKAAGPAQRVVPVTPPGTGANPVKPPAAAALPRNPPFGEYAVYQWNGAGGFAYQYRFTLVNATRYRVRDNEWGTYAYAPGNKQLRFTSGPLKGFGGLYYTTGRNADGPTIALSANGTVTRLETAANGAYQFAYFRPDGVQ